MPLPPASAWLAVFLLRVCAFAWQQDRHLGALAELASDLDRAAGLVGKAVNLRQAKPGALADRLGGEEGVKDLVEQVGRNTGAAIRDGDGNMITRMQSFGKAAVARRHHDDAATGRGIAGIDHEVDESGFQFGDVDHDRPDVRRDIELQRHRAADAGVEHVAHGTDAFGRDRSPAD